MYKKTILIDLDGVLNIYTGGYQADFIPQMRLGADKFIIELAQNHELKLFTTRPQELARKWLKKNNLDEYFTEVTNIKKPAWLILDDRGMQFRGDYTQTIKDIHNFKPWYK